MFFFQEINVMLTHYVLVMAKFLFSFISFLTDIVAHTLVVSFVIKNKELREEFKDLSALETQVFVGIIIRSVGP